MKPLLPDRLCLQLIQLRSLGGTDGAVYACRKGSRAHVIKFTPVQPHDIPQIEERFAFMRYLADNGVQLAAPIDSEHGNSFEILACGETTYAVTLTFLAPGRSPQSRNGYDWNNILFHRWGQMMGQMHALARRYPRWEKTPETGGSPETHILDWADEHRFFGNWCQEPEIVRRWMPFMETFQALPRDRSCFGLIHNDLHQGNLLFDPDAQSGPLLTIIDFDVCAYHWFITDIAVAVYHAVTDSLTSSLRQREEKARRFIEPFLRGYTLENSLDMEWLGHMPVFLNYREVLIYIALSNSWPKENRPNWQNKFLANKRRRIMAGEPVISALY